MVFGLQAKVLSIAMKETVILLCTALSACTMAKPGMTPDSKAKDRYECEKEAYDSNARGLQLDGLYRDCMRARGYT